MHSFGCNHRKIGLRRVENSVERLECQQSGREPSSLGGDEPLTAKLSTLFVVTVIKEKICQITLIVNGFTVNFNLHDT